MLSDDAIRATRAKNIPGALASALKVLLTLHARGLPEEPYLSFGFDPDYLAHYPLNLRALRGVMGRAGGWSVARLARWLATSWGVEAHFRVALRKLHGESLDTFRIRPMDDELVVVAVPEPTWTNPRLQNIERFLIDLGLAQWRPERPASVTSVGLTLLEQWRG